MTQHFDCLIVGTGHAGAQVAIALRQNGYEGSIALVGEEADAPYERPPLSKEYLAGAKPFDRLLIRPVDFWQNRDIALLLGHRVEKVISQSHSLTCADGTAFTYGTLVWAAGGAARSLASPGHDLDGIHRVRTRADVDKMRKEMDGVARVVVIGGGYIGLETAAVLRKQDKLVTVIEAMDRVLARVAGEPLSRFYENVHRVMGVDIRLGASVLGLEGTNGHVRGVRLSNGDLLPADMVIVGIGIEPSVEPLIAAGASGANGVEVDEFCRTDLPDIFAVGDCARHANKFAGGARIRLESVQNATDQATVVAKFLTGQPEPYHSVPWFWSNQYDLRLQTIGISAGSDQTVVRGDPQARKFSVIYLNQGVVQALDCVNSVKDYVEGRTLVASRARIPPDLLANSGIALKELHPGGTLGRSSQSKPLPEPVCQEVSVCQS